MSDELFNMEKESKMGKLSLTKTNEKSQKKIKFTERQQEQKLT